MIQSFQRMYGGEIFVPKIPSIRITDLAQAMAPQIPTKVVGIRPGEKLHEVMCPRDDAHLTLEFNDHFVIQPSIHFYGRESDYSRNALGEEGRSVARGYEYNSGNNPCFLTVPELEQLHR